MVGWGLGGGIETTVLDQLDPGMRGWELQRTWVGTGVGLWAQVPQVGREGAAWGPQTKSGMFCAVHCRFLPCSLFLPPHPRHKTMHCSAVGQPTKILCRLSSTFRHPPGLGRG